MATSGGSLRTELVNFSATTAPNNYGSFNKKQRFADNIAALDVLIQINDKETTATSEQQNILAKYVGWGGLKEILLNPDNPNEWKTQTDISLKPLVTQAIGQFNRLDPKGTLGLLAAARRSILNAHYTAYPVINGIYHAIEKAGFKNGNILEPAAGIGNFLAAMPDNMAEHSEVTAIEMDRVTGNILQKLFPTANTHVSGFEKLNLPENHFDLILSNIPFGDVAIFDKQLNNHKDKRFRDAAENIHNYFFAKSILLARPGAMIAFVTSRYTLDSTQNKSIRELMNDTCHFCGAIRLPDNAFHANAGTQVVTDIIFLKKQEIGEPNKQQQHDFLAVKAVPYTDSAGTSGLLTYNEYYHNNPAHMLGTPAFGGLYRKDEFNLKGSVDKSGDTLQKRIEQIAEKIFPQPVIRNRQQNETGQNTEAIEAAVERYIRLGDFDDIGNLVVLNDGYTGKITDRFHIDERLDKRAKEIGINPETIRYNRGSLSLEDEERLRNTGIHIEDFYLRIVEEVRIAKKDRPKAEYIQNMRRLAKELIAKEVANYNDFLLDKIREKLRATYNEFTFRFGHIRSANNATVLKLDAADKFLLMNLEKPPNLEEKIEPADILFHRTIKPPKEILATDDLQEAVSLSMQKFAKINTNYISELMNRPFAAIMKQQKGNETYIFQDESGQYLSREQYLSGNVADKLHRAKAFAEDNPEFYNNVLQLEQVQPTPIPAVDIYSPLHARWIDEKYLKGFVQHLLQTTHIDIRFIKAEDHYKVNINDHSAHIKSFGTGRKSPQWVITHAINGIEPKVTYVEEVEPGVKKTFVDADDTQLAKSIYRKIRSEWDDWKFSDQARRDDLAAVYNAKYNTTVLRRYDGEKLTLPGMAGYTPRPHQKDAIYRNIQQFGGINDHRVGAGKTLVQIATAMELRRLGMANKPLIIGLKSQIPQLYREFKKMYPLAKVLFPTENDFKTANRKKLLNSIATNEWDCIILSHDQFGRIGQPKEIEVQMLQEFTDLLKEQIAAEEDKTEKARLEKKLYKEEQKIEALLDTPKDTGTLDFKALGIDFLMVDESQEFKNLLFTTLKKNIRGLGNPSGSKKAFNMLVAARYLQQLHGGDKGILFASGTPVSNSMAEMYLLFKFLRPNKMKELGLTSFDRWAANFANDYSELEYYMGSFKEVHRFREFANLPELLTLYREIADVRNDSNITLDKPEIIHELVKIPPAETQLKLIEKLQCYINSKGNDFASELGLTAGYDERKGVNPSFALLAINFAKKLSLDPRLINPSYTAGSKLKTAADNISNIWLQTRSFKGTQLVFCDTGTPKSSNRTDNLYEHLSGNISQSDLEEIFGKEYYERTSKPKLEEVLTKATAVLNLNEDKDPDEPGFDELGEAKKLMQEANTAENFNVYDETKHLLMQNGIPENQIAFIHSYNTRAAKESLYEKVNKGEIRILLGSTKKLGTGVNVQERCVAGHHLDINWRPSDIEQRNGRFERQGNTGAKNFRDNKVQGYYYATERTLDASMYNTVSQKAKFIAQMKVTTNSDLRTVKDIEEDIDMGTMAAELSGDPVFKEKATLSKEITELQQLERSYKQRIYDRQNTLQQNKVLIQALHNKIDNLSGALPLFESIPKNEKGENVFSGKVNGITYEKIGEFTTAVIAEAELAKKYRVVNNAFPLGELWGFQITGIVRSDFITEEKKVFQTIHDNKLNQLADEKMIPDGEMAAGLQIRNAIMQIPEEIERIKNKIVALRNDNENYEKLLQQGFPQKDELDTKMERLEQVDKLILDRQKEINEKNMKPGGEVMEADAGELNQVKEKQQGYKFKR